MATKTARKSKLKDAGIARLKFTFNRFEAHIWIGPADAWESSPGAKPDSGWGGQFLDDGRVIAMKIAPREGYDDKIPSVRNPPWDESLASMQRLRSITLDALEQDDDVTSIDMTTGGDGQAEFRLGVDDHVERKGRHLGSPMFVRMTFFNDECEAW